MKASERLRELDAAFDTQRFLATLNYYIGPGARTLSSREQQQMYHDVKTVLVALPLIADCIEQAQKWEWVWDHADDKWRCPDCQNWEKNGHDPNCAWGRALTALRDALQQPEGDRTASGHLQDAIDQHNTGNYERRMGSPPPPEGATAP